jgi:hypothetical protein
MNKRMLKSKYRKQTRSEQGIGLILVMFLALISSILAGSMTYSLISTSQQTRLTRSYEEAYGIGLGAINKVLFEMEAAMGGNNPPTSLVELEDHLTAEFGNTPHTGTVTYNGTVDGTAYAVKMTDATIDDEKFTLTAEVDYEGNTRQVIALVKGPDIVEALRYAIFGNYIHFDNHAKVNWGINLLTTVYSNSGVDIDKGVKITGLVQAATFIAPNTGPADRAGGVADTILTVTGEQGDPNPAPVVGSAPVVQAIPPPPIKAFPNFEFAEVKAITDPLGRTVTASEWDDLLTAAHAFANAQPNNNSETAMPDTANGCPGNDCYPGTLKAANIPISVIHYNSGTPRIIRVPNVDNPTYFVELGTTSGQCSTYPCAAGSNTGDTYEIIFKHQRNGTDSDTRIYGNDSILYIDGDAEINEPTDTLVRVEGSLIVNGSFDFKSAGEILAWENRQAPWFEDLDHSIYDQTDDGNADFATTVLEARNDAAKLDLQHSSYPALAANGKIKIDGDGGPAHIEGVVYSVSESHLHRSEPHAPAYTVGSEIADVVHNCEFFSFAYDAESLSLSGFYERISARPTLKIIRLEDL